MSVTEKLFCLRSQNCVSRIVNFVTAMSGSSAHVRIVNAVDLDNVFMMLADNLLVRYVIVI